MKIADSFVYYNMHLGNATFYIIFFLKFAHTLYNNIFILNNTLRITTTSQLAK